MVVATLDATPLLGTRTGIGRYVDRLLAALPAAARRRDVDLALQVMTWSARGGRVPDLPASVRPVGRRAPARGLRWSWAHLDHPTAEALGARGDVFHGTNFVSPPTARAREVVTIHDLTYLATSSGPDGSAYTELVPRALRRGAHVLTPTRAVADLVADRYGLADERLTVTPLGVEDSWFDVRPPAAGSPAVRELPDDYLVYVGSAEERKNLPTLVDAHRALRAAGPGAPALVLAGPAGSRSLPDRMSRLGPADGVHRTGWLSDDDLRSVVAGSRALVLPSDDEGFGLPVVEALAAGRPVVVSDIPALREVGGPFVATARPRDADALAAAIDAALAAPDDAAERAARQAWARRWTWDACADATLAAYLVAAS